MTPDPITPDALRALANAGDYNTAPQLRAAADRIEALTAEREARAREVGPPDSLVERLRAHAEIVMADAVLDEGDTADMLSEAADRIEALTARRDEWHRIANDAEAERDEAVALLREFDQRSWTDCRPGLLWIDRVRAFLARLDKEANR